MHDELLRQCRPEVSSVAYTYGDIERMAASLAHKLIDFLGADIREEPKVLVLVEEGVGLVVCELGALKAGAAFVPVDPNWPAERQAFIARDSCSRVILLPRAHAEVLRNNLARAGLELSDCQDAVLGSVVGVVWEDVVENIFDDTCRSIPHLPPPFGMERRGSRCSHIVYTSGTSGSPKGVVCEHAGLLAYMHAKCITHEILPYPETAAESARGQAAERGSRPSRVLLTSAATWDPSLGDIFSTLGAGAVLCMAPRAALLSHLRVVLYLSRATHVLTTAPLWDLLGDRIGPDDVPNLEVLALGGAPFPRHYISRWARGAASEGHRGAGSAGGGGGGQGGSLRVLRLLNTYGLSLPELPCFCIGVRQQQHLSDACV